MQRDFTLSDTLAYAIGCGILGTGGGGNTYIGRTWLEYELRKHARHKNGGTVRVIDADDVPDDAYVCAIGTMGAPTVGVEKLQQGDEFVIAMRALEEHVHAPLAAILCGEIGGANGLKPLICGLQMGLPVVDGDPMGRAFPELQMDTFAIGGLSLCPMALSDAHGNVVVFDKMDHSLRVEQYARSLTIEMGGSAALAMPLLRGHEMKRHLIRGTMTLAQQIGDVVLAARKRGEEPAEAVAAIGNGRVLFRGKIVDVERRTVKGFARGQLKLVGFGNSHETMEIVFQNENLVAWRGSQKDGEIVCTVPDLICILSLEDGEPVGTESLRYGLRVAVLGMPAPKELKTAQALAVVGPQAFGYDVPFQPMAGDLL